ncbi:hypothetical protein AOLI_G00321930 [Acnodon oligacanthus]
MRHRRCDALAHHTWGHLAETKAKGPSSFPALPPAESAPERRVRALAGGSESRGTAVVSGWRTSTSSRLVALYQGRETSCWFNFNPENGRPASICSNTEHLSEAGGWGGYRYSLSPGESSRPPSEEKSKRSRILCILPSTVSQLLSATEQQGSFFIQGTEINQVGVVGIIRRTKPAGAYIVYSLDDMTGPPLDVKRWMDLEAANMNDCVIPPGTYIKVVGSLRSFQNHRSMVAFSVRRVEDYNEITSHMMEVVQAHLLNDSGSCTAMKNNAMTTMSLSRSNESTSYGFTANQSQVFNLIKSCPLPEGISVQSLMTSLKYLTPYDIRTCLKFLINEGHIFSTVDDDHFKSTYM